MAYSYEQMSEAVSGSGTDADSDAEEPRSCLARIEDSTTFKAFAISAIVLNVVSMAFEADQPDLWFWTWTDNVFLGWFVIELTIKIMVHCGDFFVNEDEGGWNIFDFVIVLTGVIDQWIMGPLLREMGPGNAQTENAANFGQLLMIMRTMRLLRILRALRLLRQFKELYLLVLGLGHSFTSVFWIMVMFMMTLVTFAIFLTTFVGHQAEMYDDPAFIAEKFGTMSRSMVTLFIFCSCDDWSTPARMVNKVYPWMFFVWMIYQLIANFTLFSMITGLMADKMKAAREDQLEAEKDDASTKYKQLMAGLQKVFIEGDLRGDGNGTLDIEEFKSILLREDVIEDLMKCGIAVSPHELDDLWKCLDMDMDDILTWDEFSQGLFQISSEVAGKDIMWLEGSVMRLDSVLKEAGIEEPKFDLHLDSLHSRASLIQQRVFQMENDVDEIFKVAGYRPA